MNDEVKTMEQTIENIEEKIETTNTSEVITSEVENENIEFSSKTNEEQIIESLDPTNEQTEEESTEEPEAISNETSEGATESLSPQPSVLNPQSAEQLEIIDTDEYKSEEEKEESSLGSIADALRNDLKSQVEAVLFVSDTPLKAGAIAKMLNTSYEDVQSALVKLIQEYEDRNGGLEIGTNDGYIIQVRTQYLNIVTDMMPLELNPGPMRTLSAIALKEPCLQSVIIDMRGSGAYDHINELVEMDLVTKKPQGLSYTLKTTQKFQQYFRLTKDANVIRDRLQAEAAKRAKEKEKLEEENNMPAEEIASV